MFSVFLVKIRKISFFQKKIHSHSGKSKKKSRSKTSRKIMGIFIFNCRSCSRKPSCLLDVHGTKVRHDWVNEIFAHDDSSNWLPVRCVLSKQKTNWLQGEFHNCWRVCHRTNLNEMLFLDRFHGCLIRNSRNVKVRKER